MGWHFDDICTSRLSRVLATTMIHIQESEEKLRSQRIRRIGNAIAHDVFDVAKEMLYCING
jgi:hypothetical protein